MGNSIYRFYLIVTSIRRMRYLDMTNNKQSFYLQSIFICGLIFCLLTVSQAYAARKGTAGSLERKAWCSSKMDDCVSSANDDCDDTRFNTSTALALCKSSEVKACKDTYGSTSDCLTRDKVTTVPRKAKAVTGQKVHKASKESTDVRKPSANKTTTISSPPKIKTIKKSTQHSRFINSLNKSGTSGVAITVNDCTFYGGTVQKDNSCGTKKSCIIGTNNGCITKAAK